MINVEDIQHIAAVQDQMSVFDAVGAPVVDSVLHSVAMPRGKTCGSALWPCGFGTWWQL